MKHITFAIALLLNIGLFAQKPVSTALPRPKLVVGIVVDQMRWDYLYRYYDRYSENGFKRMLSEGHTCENTIIDYVPTVTAIGHSTIYTGSVPAIHGITGNEFIINATGKTMYCTEDSSVQTVGSPSDAGQMSPRNLWSSTICDELKLATNFRSKVIGISLKDRGGILPAGHTANAAYWFDDSTGNWITSTYYMNQLPTWVKQFNDSRFADKFLKQDWNTLHNINTYIQSSPDDSRYEGRFTGSATSTFPVKTSGMYSTTDYDIIRTTPYGNTITLDFAKAAIEKEALGKGAVTDFLAVSCSSTDYVGHKFGINAIEIEDTYLRLDRDLADFFLYLDKNIGKGTYTVFLTADHGAAHNPGFLIEKNIPAGYFASSGVLKETNRLLQAAFNIKNLVMNFSNSQVHLNYDLIRSNNLNEDAIHKECISILQKQPGVAFVVDLRKIREASIPDELMKRIINGYNTERSGSIQIIQKPGWYSGAPAATGTTHGSWNGYDAHIPLVWMGWGIKPGKTARQTNMTDISATLAALLRIQAPNGSIGKVITEVMK